MLFKFKITNPATENQLIMTKHALQRAIERGILEDHVETVMNNPIETIYDEQRGNFKTYTVVDFPKSEFRTQRLSKNLLVIHHPGLENQTSIIIITVLWIDERGLKRIGFNNL